MRIQASQVMPGAPPAAEEPDFDDALGQHGQGLRPESIRSIGSIGLTGLGGSGRSAESGESAGSLADRLANLAEDLPRNGLPGREIVERARRRLVEPRVSIAFGGLFKAGKSTLINGLLGRPVLPTDALPETGAACGIRSGTEDRARLIRRDDPTPQPIDVADIRRRTGLVDSDGRRREEQASEVDRIELTLAGIPIPVGAEWIDCPGIDDSPEMSAAAAQAAEGADLLVWVLSSRHPLTEPEMAFLADRIERAGPASLLFVLNLIGGPGGSVDADRLLDALEPKLAAFWNDLGTGCGAPPIVPIDAARLVDEPRGAEEPDAADRARDANTASGFLGSLLRELGRADHPRVVRARAGRMAPPLREVRQLVDAVRTRRAAEAETAERRCADHERLAATLREEIGRSLEAFFHHWRIDVRADAAVRKADIDTTLRSGQELPGDAFSFPVERAHAAQSPLLQRLDELATRHGLEPLDEPSRQSIRGRLLPQPLVPTTSLPEQARVGQAMAIGAAVGSVVPVLGTVVGAAVGGAISWNARRQWRSYATDTMRRWLGEAVEQSVAEMESRRPGLEDWIAKALAGAPPSATGHRAALGACERVLARIDECLDLAEMEAALTDREPLEVAQ